MIGRRRRLSQLLLFPSPCAWCGKPIPPEKRGDSKFCGKRHRQASWRWRVDGPDLEVDATGPPMRFAYADPPYPGLANYYPEREEVDHASLVDRLVAEFRDGW
jgi:hypothetical protein